MLDCEGNFHAVPTGSEKLRFQFCTEEFSLSKRRHGSGQWRSTACLLTFQNSDQATWGQNLEETSEFWNQEPSGSSCWRQRSRVFHQARGLRLASCWKRIRTETAAVSHVAEDLCKICRRGSKRVRFRFQKPKKLASVDVNRVLLLRNQRTPSSCRAAYNYKGCEDNGALVSAKAQVIKGCALNVGWQQVSNGTQPALTAELDVS